MEAIAIAIGTRLGEYILAGDFSAVGRLVDMVRGVRESEDSDEVQVARLTALMSGIAREKASSATSLAEAAQKRHIVG